MLNTVVHVNYHVVFISYHEVRVINSDPELDNTFFKFLNKLP